MCLMMWRCWMAIKSEHVKKTLADAIHIHNSQQNNCTFGLNTAIGVFHIYATSTAYPQSCVVCTKWAKRNRKRTNIIPARFWTNSWLSWVWVQSHLSDPRFPSLSWSSFSSALNGAQNLLGRSWLSPTPTTWQFFLLQAFESCSKALTLCMLQTIMEIQLNPGCLVAKIHLIPNPMRKISNNKHIATINNVAFGLTATIIIGYHRDSSNKPSCNKGSRGKPETRISTSSNKASDISESCRPVGKSRCTKVWKFGVTNKATIQHHGYSYSRSSSWKITDCRLSEPRQWRPGQDEAAGTRTKGSYEGQQNGIESHSTKE